MKLPAVFLTLLLMAQPAFSQKNEIIPLWPGKVPGEKAEKAPAVKSPATGDNITRIELVTDPELEVFLPAGGASNKSAIVVCPGGGYHILAYDLEGSEVAGWFNAKGYTVFVLKYRVPDKREGALQDVQRAVRLVRSRAEKYGIDPEKVGVMGFSAGGSLSARASTLYGTKTYQIADRVDSLSCKPSFALLIYPAYLDQGPGKTLTPELVMSKNNPPFFIFQTADDQYANSALVLAEALRDAGTPVELHLLSYGGHGYGLRNGKHAAETWPVLAAKWLENIFTSLPE
jgi:acetyl esterase/lipase